jgi:hypothetical protein
VHVQVQVRDRYGHFGVFLLVWVPSMDLYEHLDYNRVYSLAESSFFSGTCMPK